MSKPTILVISQVYPPDAAAVGLYMHEAAVKMLDRGYRVVVYAASRGYDDASERYKLRENLDGVTVRRLPLSSFGKSSIKVRLIAQSLFLIQVMIRGLFLRRLDRILVSTSPPMASIAANFIRFFRRVPITFWAMDINPDQVVAMGQLAEGSMPVRVFDAINRAILKRARGVVALDRYMASRLEGKHPVGDRMSIIPPWPHEGHLESVEHTDNPFREEQGLQDKFVVMYSGNISDAHPVTTILEAAVRLQDEPRLLFLFVGGGNAKERIERFVVEKKVNNIRTLPYQPLDKLKFSLSAADVHLVSMGNEMVGIVHPCKAYGAMTVARPIFLLGPQHSHVGELLENHDIGWQIEHGDIQGAEALLRDLVSIEKSELESRGRLAREVIQQQLSMDSLSSQFCDVLELN